MVVNDLKNYEIVGADSKGLERAATELKNGRLAALPTETVYGLGASAWDEKAVERIFELKGRPFTDPLIVHVNGLEMAFELCCLNPAERRIFHILARAFWPGPLTLVVPAIEKLPRIVTGGGDTVGLRCPRHPVALKLISLSGLPLAAPSANRFGHVSPTTAQHVADDLGRDGLVIVDGGQCDVGIESTVLKIESGEKCVILRRGAVSAAAIANVFSEESLKCDVFVNNRFALKTDRQESPGELLIHYSPILPTYLLSSSDSGTPFQGKILLRDCALIDIGARFSNHSRESGYYVDISEKNDMFEASERVFSVLREVEKLDFVKAILVPDLRQDGNEMALAIADRLSRAAALKRALIFNQFVQVDV